MSRRTYRTFQAMLLGGWAFFLLHRFWSGQIVLYIHQRYHWLVLLTAFGLLIAALTIFNHRPPIRSDGDSIQTYTEAPAGAKWRLIGVFLPLALGVLVPINPLDAEAAESRQVQQTLSFTANLDVSESILSLDPSNRSILEWLWIFDITEDKSIIEGQPVKLEGFVLPGENLPEGQFLVARFVITCCVSDATAIGVTVKPPDTGTEFSDGWVRVTGTMRVGIQNGEETPVIDALDIQRIQRPDEPYLYQ